MHPRFIVYIIFCVIFCGCSHWETKKISKEKFFQDAWQTITINEVDTYPSFEHCSELQEKTKQRECFVNGIHNKLQEHLNQYSIVLTNSFTDSLQIYCMVNEKGFFCIDSMQVSSQLRNTLPEIELWIHDGFKTIPKVIPATKQGIPVNMRFEVPVVFQEN